MTDNLIERLRGYGDGNNDLMDAAADRIEKLEAALREIENEINSPDDDFPLAFGCMRMIINKALEGKDD